MKMINWVSLVFEEMINRKIDSNIESKIAKNGGFLFHVSPIQNSINIMKHNYFRPSPGTIHIMGLSTTFDPNYKWGSSDVKFVLDYKKIKKDFDMMFIDEGLGVDESEIKIIANSAILNANKYVVDVIYKGHDEKMLDLISLFLNKG
jgi:hypothetical protein